MEWILIAGALCLSSHHEICVKQNSDALFEVTSAGVRRAYDVQIGQAIAMGEYVAKDGNETAGQRPLGTGQAICASCDISLPKLPKGVPTVEAYPTGPYGMTKEEFGAFIEEHVKAGIGRWLGAR